jgi:hypothetical protein
MRKISSIIATPDFHLLVKFENGVQKNFDFKPYLQFPVFSVLKNIALFQKIDNHGYFIEWQGQEIDLSADTLWHEGK